MQWSLARLLVLSLIVVGATTPALAAQEGAEPLPSADPSIRATVVTALDDLVAALVAERPADAAAYTERVRAYLEVHPAFFGSAVVLLDRAGTVTASPYVYRTANGYATSDLALVPSYHVETQAWFTAPLEANAGIWTDPYFDAGGGEIWMITRAVPARDAEGILAIVTTDLPVETPAP